MMGSMIFLYFHLVVSLLTKHDADMPRDLNGQQNNENDYLRRFREATDDCGIATEYDETLASCEHCGVIGVDRDAVDNCNRSEYETPGECIVTCPEGKCDANYENDDEQPGQCKACDAFDSNDNCRDGQRVRLIDGDCTVSCMEGGCEAGYTNDEATGGCTSCGAIGVAGGVEAVADCVGSDFETPGDCTVTCPQGECAENFENDGSGGCTECAQSVEDVLPSINCRAEQGVRVAGDCNVTCREDGCENGYVHHGSDDFGYECRACDAPTDMAIDHCVVYDYLTDGSCATTGLTCAKCLEGYHPVTVAGEHSCEACTPIDFCSQRNYSAPGETCDSTCTECLEGHSLDDTGSECTPCTPIANCDQHNYSASGLTCDATCNICDYADGTMRAPSTDGSACVECERPESYAADGRLLIEGCVERSTVNYLREGESCAAECVTCDSGYGSDSAGGCDVCDTSALNCQAEGVTYTTPGDCSSATCQPGFCNNGYVSDSAGPGCVECDTTVVAATLKCTVNDVTYTADTSDDSCNATCRPGSCIDGYQSDSDARCVACDTSALNCQAGGVTYPNPGRCLRAFCSADQCESGYVSNFSGGCESCPLHCAECYYDRLEFSTSCRQCDDGYGYDDDGQCRSCSPGLPGLYNPRELQGCDCSVIDHCVECDEDDQHQCKTCADGYAVWDSFSGEKYECVKKTDGGGKTEGSNTWIYSLVAGVFLFILLIFILFLVVKARNNAEAAEGTPQAAI